MKKLLILSIIVIVSPIIVGDINITVGPEGAGVEFGSEYTMATGGYDLTPFYVPTLIRELSALSVVYC